jgi:carboxyl-terminal processing protease
MIRAGLVVVAVLVATAAASICYAQTAASVAPSQLTGKQHQLNIDSFEYVWTTVRDKHWQAQPAGLDWQAVHEELRPAIEKASTMEATRAVLNDMLGRLHETHFAIIPSDLYSDLDGSSAKGEITTGMDVRVAGSDVLVASVESGSSAAREGVQPGWQILKIGSTDLGPVIEKLNRTYARSTLRELVLREAILARLGSKPGEPVGVEFLDGANQRITKSLAQGKPRGALSQFGFLYPMHVWFDSSKFVNATIGYVKFNIFLDPAHVMNQFGEAVEGCKACQGFIIDLRGNPGGIGAMAMGMAGWFIDQPDQRLGTLYMRDTTLKFVVNPRVYTFAGPLAILVDGASASTSEILAGGLKDLGRARIFGTRTAAAALPSVFEMLPNGDGFQYAIANYISQGGKPLEGLGVTPDVETPLTRQSLLAGKDPALDAAVIWIQSAAANQKQETRN